MIDAFGPKEHIDVRETQKRRAIKLRIIELIVMNEVEGKPGKRARNTREKDLEVLH